MMNATERASRLMERDAAHGVVMRERQEQERAARPLKADEPGDYFRYTLKPDEIRALHDRREELVLDRAVGQMVARQDGRV